MATNINQENTAIANELGIPRFKNNQQQRNYYQYHFRHCTLFLQWLMIINFVLILIILYIFFTRSGEHCYSTSFDGVVTPLHSYTLAEAQAITQQNKLQGDNS